MYLTARVLKVGVKKNPRTPPSYFLEAKVIDVDTMELYQCSFRESFGAERLQKAYRDNLPEQEQDMIAADVEANAKRDIENQEVALIVDTIRSNKDFVTLIVRKR